MRKYVDLLPCIRPLILLKRQGAKTRARTTTASSRTPLADLDPNIARPPPRPKRRRVEPDLPIFRHGQNSQDTPTQAQRRRDAVSRSRENRYRRRNDEEELEPMAPPTPRPALDYGSSQIPQYTNTNAGITRLSQETWGTPTQLRPRRRPIHRTPRPRFIDIRQDAPYIVCAECCWPRPAFLCYPPFLSKCRYCVCGLDSGEVEIQFCLEGSHYCRQERFLGPGSHRLLICTDCYQRNKLFRYTEPEDERAVHDDVWSHVQGFYTKLDSIGMAGPCLRCHERWFDVVLTPDGICKSCVTRDKALSEEDETYLMSALNCMDPGDVPSCLPRLTQVEEMLIARAHVHVQVRTVRGLQYKYSGHVVTFMQNVPRMYNDLPVFPGDLNQVILEPPNSSSEPRLRRQFQADFRVNRHHVLQWLLFLKAHHPDYRNITIRYDILNTLPTDLRDWYVEHSLPDIESGGSPSLNTTEGEGDAEPTTQDGVIPNLAPNNSEAELLITAIQAKRRAIRLPTMSSQPLSEFSSRRLFAMAFPTLFPRGQGDWHQARLRSVSLHDYAAHLMRYYDGRFARHPRFRYVVFNRLMRLTVDQSSRYYISKNSSLTNLSIEELEELMVGSQNKSTVDSFARVGGKLKGSRPYWKQASWDVQAFVKQLGCPDLFLTLSAADMQWPDLHRHMPQYELFLSGTSEEKKRLIRDNVQGNPHIIAHYFFLRRKLYYDAILKPLLGVDDYWDRDEFQGRGTEHLHALIWIGSTHLHTVTDDTSAAAFAEFWGRIVSAWNHNPNRPPDPVHPSAVSHDQIQNTKDQVTAFLNRLQRHMCGGFYCQRKRKDTGHVECRFKFPKAGHPYSWVTKANGAEHLMFDPRRNDVWLNSYVPALLLAWRANMDFSPCTSVHAVVQYIAKYCTKAETKTNSYEDIVRQSIHSAKGSRLPAFSALSKMLNSLITERDWSAQEVSHILLGLPLQQRSRDVTFVNCLPDHDQRIQVEVNEDERGHLEQAGGESIMSKYMKRSDAYESTTLLQFLLRFNKTTRKPARQSTKDHILRYWPAFSSDPDSSLYENWCRMKVLLHHPYRIEDSLRCENDDELLDWPTVYKDCQLSCGPHPPDFLPDLASKSQADDELDDEYDSADEMPDSDEPYDFMILAGRSNNRGGVVLEHDAALGERALDREHDWMANTHAFADMNPDWLKTQRDTCGDNIDSYGAQPCNPSSLTERQRAVFDLFANHFEAIGAGNAPPQILLNLDGPAGTGKSYLIETLSSHLAFRCQHLGIKDPVVRTGPTGVAAYNIRGKTLHQLLSLPVQGKFEPLSNQRLIRLQRALDSCRYLIIDEKSMVSLQQLSRVHARLLEAFPSRRSEPFAGLNILLCGDFAQLPPVMGKALYARLIPQRSSTDVLHAREYYHCLAHTVVLDRVIRQGGSDRESVRFRNTLDELRNNKLSKPHWEMLLTRVEDNLPLSEIEEFGNSLRIFYTHRDVDEYNGVALRDMQAPIVVIRAIHSDDVAARASEEKASGLQARLVACIGARVMLRHNLWTSRGLVNGSLGTIKDIAWAPGSDPRATLPVAIFVAFDGYTGPTFTHPVTQEPLVPVRPVETKWQDGNTERTRRQFPLDIAFAITVHKSQGMTLDQAVMDISRKEHTPGLTYVAVSRVRSMKGLMFCRAFDYSRFENDPGLMVQSRHDDTARRHEQQNLQPLIDAIACCYS